MGGMELQDTLVMMQLDLTSQMLELPDAARSSPGYGKVKEGLAAREIFPWSSHQRGNPAVITRERNEDQRTAIRPP